MAPVEELIEGIFLIEYLKIFYVLKLFNDWEPSHPEVFDTLVSYSGVDFPIMLAILQSDRPPFKELSNKYLCVFIDN